MTRGYRKTGSAQAVASEVASLAWLAQAADECGGAPVVEVLGTGPTWIETRYVSEAAPTLQAAEEFGRCLARTHAAGADWWGQPPPGLAPEALRTTNLAKPASSRPVWGSWGEFFAEARILPYVDQLRLSPDDDRLLRRAADVIASGAWDAPQPGLCGEVARIHGDLWGGNVLWTAGGGVLIDACAYGSHAEADLADLALFGSPHLDRTVAAYDEVSPLADGWRDRVVVHQLHMLLIHVVLFGGSYLGSTLRAAKKAAEPGYRG
ncbi:fructosamine kinase family protein [Tessaracoccus caeni]|uniref:fructosamine kinase family protein n=1 Tax=Tessaracoccus caeni TaxID=3031239 RepID=UPI0023DA556B|nr:fructosamine kinase family protein [Tessaracoccus caeni]